MKKWKEILVFLFMIKIKTTHSSGKGNLKKFKKMMKKAELFSLIGEYIMYTADVLTYGTNPCLAAAFDHSQLKIYEHQAWYFDEMAEAAMLGHHPHKGDGMKGKRTGKHMKEKKHHGSKNGMAAEIIDLLSFISNDANWVALASQSAVSDYQCLKAFWDDWKSPFTTWNTPALFDSSVDLNGTWFNESGLEKWYYATLESTYIYNFIMSIVAVFVDGINLDALAELPRFAVTYFRAEVDFATTS